MDIRKWFTSSSDTLKKSIEKKPQTPSPTKNTKKSRKRIIESDSDDEDGVSIKKVKTKPFGNGKKRSSPTQDGSTYKKIKAEAKRRNGFLSSDDEVDEIQLKPDKNDQPRSTPKKTLKTKLLKPVIAEVRPLKVATVSDFFGSAPIHRAVKKSPKKEPKAPIETNHDDNDFEKTLKQLDETDAAPIETNHDDNDFEKTLKQLDETDAVKRGNISEVKENGKVKPKSLSPPKKKKHSKKFSSDIEIIPPTPVEKKKKVVVEVTPPAKKKVPNNPNRANYMSYMNREGPRALGSKEVPEPEKGCLSGKTFVITGVLESIERDEAKVLVEKCNGKVMTTLTKNTNYMIVGRDAGASKLEKAEQFHTIILDEDGLFDLVRNSYKSGPKKTQVCEEDCFDDVSVSSDKTSPKKDISPKKERVSPKKERVSPKKQNDSSKVAKISPKKEKDTDINEIIKEEKKTDDKNANMFSKFSFYNTKRVDIEKSSDSIHVSPSVSTSIAPSEAKTRVQSTQMWVDKYKPTSLKQVIGQQGANSNAKKLVTWLNNWHKNAKSKKKPLGGSRWNTNDDGSAYKAALLSGSPGVGKTTTAHLACKEAGFDFFELNASDTRSKKSLHNIVAEILLNQSLSQCFNGTNSGTVSKDHAIIMDEVDGMAGNEDRGGIQELITFIKASKIPLICICNDRNHTKIRSLSNYCFDLRFQRPRVEQIKAAMMSIAFKEKINIAPTALQDVITASNQDVRQVLHNMSLWSSRNKKLTAEQTKQDIGFGTKHIKMSPFDVLREVFTIGQNKKASISDKSNLFFHDYSIAPLFVQENYVHVLSSEAGGDPKKHLRLLSEAANYICIGDLIDKRIRSQQSWSLLPTQAIFASVLPGELLTGHLKQMISFPSWLGKNSNRNYMHRILQELQMHMRMRITGSKTDIALDYLPLLQRALTKPLLDKETEGVKDVLRVMENYYLLREDYDSVMELSLWSHQQDPRTKIATKVKSAFTRAYNKECGKNPYAVSNVSKKKKGSQKENEDFLAEGEEPDSEDEGEDDDNVENDAMIKVKKPSTKKQGQNVDAGCSSSSKKAPAKKNKTKK